MNKPDWSKAPSWSKWLAQDKDGQWFWWENEPHIRASIDFWMPSYDQRCNVDRASSILQDPVLGWKETLEPRP